MIDNIITSTPCFDNLKRAPRDQLIYYQDENCIRLLTINAALDPVSYAQAISNISDENDFACSMGHVHELLSKTDSGQLFAMYPIIPLSVNSITDGIQTGVKVSHLSKI